MNAHFRLRALRCLVGHFLPEKAIGCCGRRSWRHTSTVSAFFINSIALQPCSGKIATPIEAPTLDDVTLDVHGAGESLN